MSRRIFVKGIEENLEDIQIPDIQVEPIPEIESEIPPKPETVTIAKMLKELETRLYYMLIQSTYAPAWEAFFIQIYIRITLLLIAFLWLFQPILDPLFSAMQDITYNVYVALIQFKNAVEKDYQGDWVKAIIELTLRVLLLQTLASALNIPSINQLWNTIKNSVNGIINEFNTLTNEINEGLNNLADWFESVIGEIPEWLQYILQEQIRNLRQEFNILLQNIQNAFIREINEFKQTYFRDIDQIRGWIVSVDNEIKQFRQELEPSIRDTIRRLITPVGFEGIWNLLQDLWNTLALTFKVFEYTLYGSIIAVLNLIKTWQVSTTEVDTTELLRDIVNDIIYERGPFINLANKIQSEIDDIYTKYDRGIPNRVKITGLTENDIDIRIG